MAVLKRRQGVRDRRETDGIVKSFKATKSVHEALGIVCELFETENYRDRTINDYRKYWAEFMEVAGIQPTDNVTNITEDHGAVLYINDVQRTRSFASNDKYPFRRHKVDL